MWVMWMFISWSCVSWGFSFLSLLVHLYSYITCANYFCSGKQWVIWLKREQIYTYRCPYLYLYKKKFKQVLSFYKEKKTYLTYIFGFGLLFLLAPHILTLFWPCRSIEPFIRFKSKHGSPCSMLSLGSVPCRRKNFYLLDLTIVCIPSWSTQQLLFSALLNTKHRYVQVTDPAGYLCRGSLWTSPTGEKSMISPFKYLKKNWQEGNPEILLWVC